MDIEPGKNTSDTGFGNPVYDGEIHEELELEDRFPQTSSRRPSEDKKKNLNLYKKLKKKLRLLKA